MPALYGLLGRRRGPDGRDVSPVEVDGLGGGAHLAIDTQRLQGGIGLSVAVDVAHGGAVEERPEGDGRALSMALFDVGQTEIVEGLGLQPDGAVLGERVLEHEARLRVSLAVVEL